jgi:LPS export ABC transporter protein LptC
MSWRWISVAALLAAVVALYGALVDRNDSSSGSDETMPPPGYYLKDAIITQTQADGSPDLRLVAVKIEQQRKDESILLDTVHVDYLKIPERHWVLTADHGTIPENSRIVEFSGNVELRPAEARPQAYLRTEALAIDTVNNLAYTTQSPVKIKFGAYTMTVKRLEADLVSEKIKLEAARGNSGS